MLHVKSCNAKSNSKSIFCYFASAVNSNQSTRSLCYLWLLNPSKSHEKLVMFLYTPFTNGYSLVYSNWALYHLTQLISQTRWSSLCADSPDQDSPDYRSAHNKELRVKFIQNDSLGPRFSVHCPYQRESVSQRFFLKKIII